MGRDMEVFVPSKEIEYMKVVSGSGWIWARVIRGGNSLSYKRERGQSGELVSDFTFW